VLQDKTYLFDDNRLVFDAFLNKSFDGKGKEICEVELLKEGNRGGTFVLEYKSKPIFGVFPASNNIIDNKGNEEQNQSSCACGNERVQKPELVDLVSADNSDESSCAAGRMNCSRECHHGDCHRDGNG